jgi:hypothetical protein
MQFVDSKSKNIWGCLKFIIGKGVAFNWCEDKIVRDFSKLKPISVETLQKYMDLLTEEIENKIREMLPEKFGVIIDGSEHFFAIFACFPDQAMENRECLLAFAPPMQEDDLSAASLLDLIIATLSLYSKSLENIVFFCGDNCSVNCKLSDDTSIPLIGCASHRLNLAVQEYLHNSETLLNKIDQLMRKLQTIKFAARLREETHLSAIRRNLTRWSSTFNMIERYLKIKDNLPTQYAEVADLVPTARESILVKDLFDSVFKEFQAATLVLQNNGLSLGDARAVFDSLLSLDVMRGSNFGQNHLLNSSRVVHSKHFESAIVKLCNDGLEDMTNMEKNAVECFKLPANVQTSDEELPAAIRAIKKRKTTSPEAYSNADWIPPTSNTVERFFSVCKQVYTKYRKRLLPVNLEMQLFLKLHSDFWVNDSLLVAKVVNADK